MQSIKYALQHKELKELLGFMVSSNDGQDFCNDVSYSLAFVTGNVWLVDTPEHAEYVRTHSTEWYNAGYDTPQNHNNPDDLEVVEYVVQCNPESVILPTFKDIMLWKDKKYNEHGHAYFIDNPQYKQEYTLYDLREYLFDNKDK